MEPHRLAYILFSFGYVLIFGILSATTFLLHIPKEKGMESYSKARISLGFALLSIFLYSLIQFLIPQEHISFVDFWLLMMFTLLHSWFTYTTMLFLLETPKFITKHFIVDGIMPVTLMVICGIIGVSLPETIPVIQVVFGIIFGMKCSYMFYICLKEYKKCKDELDNYYDENPDIRWIKYLIFLSLFMSVFTIVAFYEHSVHLIYYLSVPVIYFFIVFKVINFAPRKIDAIRKKNNEMEQPAVKPKKPLEIDEKIGPKVEVWVKAKKYCIPELTIKDVAQEIGTNHNYLSTYINKYLDMSFQVWLNTLRVEESKRLLTDGTKRSIEEIGTMVGFSQLYNFSRWFKTVTGTTPFQYRKSN